jgi:hypothetical protein
MQCIFGGAVFYEGKSGFMPGFEAIVGGERVRVEPSFIERARWRWQARPSYSGPAFAAQIGEDMCEINL